MSYLSLVRHAELVSVSFIFDDQLFDKKTLKQVQGDILIMTDNGHSIIK